MPSKLELHAEAIALLKRRTAIEIKIRNLTVELHDTERDLSTIDQRIAAAPDAQTP